MRIYSLLFVVLILVLTGIHGPYAHGDENTQKTERHRVDIVQFRLDIPYTLLVDGKETPLNPLACVPQGSKAILIAGDTEIVSVLENNGQHNIVPQVLIRAKSSSHSSLDALQENLYLPEGVILSKKSGVVWIGNEEVIIPFEQAPKTLDCYFELVPNTNPPAYRYVEKERNIGTQYRLRIKSSENKYEDMSIKIDYVIASGRTAIPGVNLDVGPLTITTYEEAYENLAMTGGDTLFITKNVGAEHALVSVIHLVIEDKIFPPKYSNGRMIAIKILHLPGFSETTLKHLGAKEIKTKIIENCPVFQLSNQPQETEYLNKFSELFPKHNLLSAPRLTLGEEPAKATEALNYLNKQIQLSDAFVDTLEEDMPTLEPASIKILADATGDNPREGNWLGTMVLAARPISANPPYVYLLIEHWNDMEAIKMDQHVFNVTLPIEQQSTYLLWPKKVEKRELVIIVEVTPINN